MSDVFFPQPPTLADVWLSRSGLHNCKLHIVLNRVQTNLFPRFSISDMIYDLAQFPQTPTSLHAVRPGGEEKNDKFFGKD